MIKPGDIVYHTYSRLYFRCENPKMAKWMSQARDINNAPTYHPSILPDNYIL